MKSADHDLRVSTAGLSKPEEKSTSQDSPRRFPEPSSVSELGLW